MLSISRGVNVLETYDGIRGVLAEQHVFVHKSGKVIFSEALC